MDQRTHELIDRYLDLRLKGSEWAELEKRLVEDREAAVAFAQATRLDAGLESLLCEGAAATDMAKLFRHVEFAGKAIESTGKAPVGSPQRRTASSWKVAAACMAVGVLLAVGIWLLVPGTDRPEEEIAARSQHEVVSGEVYVDGATQESLPDGSAIEVSDAGPATIRLADGSEVEFGASSRAILHGSADGKRETVELVEGQGEFRVKAGEDLFEVKTVIGRVRVLGTKFSVQLQDREHAEKANSNKANPNKEGEEGMKAKVALMVVAVLAGTVEVDIAGKTYKLSGGNREVYGAEGRLEGSDAVRPMKPSLPAALKGFSGQLTGTVVGIQDEGKGFQLKVDDVSKIHPRNEASNHQAAVGRTMLINVQWAKGEGGGWRPVEPQVRFVRSLRRGEKISIHVRNMEGERLHILELTQDQRNRPHKGVGDRKREGEGERGREGDGEHGQRSEGDRRREGEGERRVDGEGDRRREGEGERRVDGDGDCRREGEGEGKPKPHTMMGELSKIGIGRFTISRRGDRGVTSTTFSVDRQTQVLVQTGHYEVVGRGEGGREIKRPKLAVAKGADVKTGRRVEVTATADGRATRIVFVRQPPPKTGGEGERDFFRALPPKREGEGEHRREGWGEHKREGEGARRREGEGERRTEGERERESAHARESGPFLPDGLKGFSGQLVGTVERVDPNGQRFVLNVREVSRVWKNNKAKNPQAAAGKRLLISAKEEGHVKFVRSLKRNEAITIEARNSEGERLYVLELSEEQRKRAR